MLLVYTHRISPRLKYIFKHICTRVLDIPVSFTSTIEDFIAHKGMKMSYTIKPLGNEIFIKSHGLLFEQGLSDIDINVQSWGQTKCFFKTDDKSSLPFDIFAAAFYMLSRYEEYLPHVKDDYGRFTAKESLAFKHGFLDQPVVDIWAFEFRRLLKAHFSNFNFNDRKYTVNPVIDVPMAFYFKHKGLMRSIGGTLNDLTKFKFKRLYNRFLVNLGIKPDPYNT